MNGQIVSVLKNSCRIFIWSKITQQHILKTVVSRTTSACQNTNLVLLLAHFFSTPTLFTCCLAVKFEISHFCVLQNRNNRYTVLITKKVTMFALVNRILDWFKSLFWKEEMELTLVGLQYSGKTTFVNVIAVSVFKIAKFAILFNHSSSFFFILILLQSGQFSEDMIPTVGFNMRKITKGNVTIKLWDIGGQPRFRSMWERYCRGVNAIV